ncbi:MAG TPA: ABC transporter ATP-binding protein, partial [Actinophytocola sp.]|nr:ABC transporter ATP-binding protein [Actinophytocola sp.]
RELVMFGPREVLLTSEEPAVKQFLNGSRLGPIGMSEEKDDATMAAELAAGVTMVDEIRGVPPQLEPTPGLPDRQAVHRRRARVTRILHTLPPAARHSILASLDTTDRFAR